MLSRLSGAEASLELAGQLCSYFIRRCQVAGQLDLKIRHKSMVSVTLTPSGWQRVAARIVNGNY